ncbi:histone acetyltransferase [Microbacterium mangrovi]|uniref:Histone acetyltransferase n=1 Tax=Microbacterium mangrovi TaxID=1348253 RepID=A0A0B2A6T4_9MICO|nr:GNAT family N-acetyltransferase [Microbacterium mangrovi]KHK97488.1 histone acetyltransferase [Microbacterium mangrovi]
MTAHETTALPSGVTLTPLHIPASVDAPDAADFIDMVRARNAIYEEINGTDDETVDAAELLPGFQHTDYSKRSWWVVRQGDRAVGRVGIELPQEEGSHIAYWWIELVRSVWGQGIGSAAYEMVEQRVRAEGRTVMQAWASHVQGDGERLAPPTGFGTVPRDHAARFLERRGHTLEQIERQSVLNLDPAAFARIEDLLGEARKAAADYEIVQWMLPTPDELVDDYAWLKSRMSTDAPAADLDVDEETWDAARVRDHDARYVESGRAAQVTAARHVATGTLAAFNELVAGTDRSRPTMQEDTLVLREHRGHRLGMLVKCAGLLSWREVAPQSRRVLTWNAEENRPMLDINEAIGFAPMLYNGAWKKELS